MKTLTHRIILLRNKHNASLHITHRTIQLSHSQHELYNKIRFNSLMHNIVYAVIHLCPYNTIENTWKYKHSIFLQTISSLN